MCKKLFFTFFCYIILCALLQPAFAQSLAQPLAQPFDQAPSNPVNKNSTPAGPKPIAPSQFAQGMSGVSGMSAVSAPPIKITYGYDQEFPPYTFMQDGGQPVGFDVDLVYAIFQGKKVNLQLRNLAWENIQLELANNQITFTSGMLKTVQRADKYIFSSKPTVAANLRFFTKNQNRLPSITLLRGNTVAVEEKSLPQFLIQQYGGLIVKTYKTKQDAVKALYNDEVFAYCGPAANALYIMKKFRYTDISAMGTPLNLSDMYFAVNKERPEVAKMIDDGMNSIIKSGEYERIYRKWFVTDITNEERQSIITAAGKAIIGSYCPYSGQPGGAAVLTQSGRVYAGAKVENADEKLSITPLRSALVNAAATGDMEVKAVVIVDEKGNVLAPTSSDLQFLYEFGRGSLVVLQDKPGSFVTKTVGELLPNPVVKKAVQALEE